MLPTIIYLSDFVDFELNNVEQSDTKIQQNGNEEEKILSKQALKYWVVIAAKVDFINNKVI